jgi:hypothetical protein
MKRVPGGELRRMPRLEIPPPGPRLEFSAWCQVLTVELRRYLPDVRASMNRRADRATWRYDGQEVTAHNDRGVFLVRIDPRFGALQDAERHDNFTARNFGKTIAGHFDPRFSVA